MTLDAFVPRSAATETPSTGSWSRRSFLSVMSALSAGAVVGCRTNLAQDGDGLTGGALGAARGSGEGSGAARSFGGGLGTAHGPGGGVGTSRSSGPDRVGVSGISPTAPFALNADVELTEDYFTVINHPINPKTDTVVAYSRADGQVEAVILQDGVVKQVYRDPTQPGGWNVYALPDADNVTAMVAAVSGAYTSTVGVHVPATLTVFYTTKNSPNTLVVAAEQPGSGVPGAVPSFRSSTQPWSSASYQLRLSVNYDQSLLVAAIAPSSKTGAKDARLYFYCDRPGKVGSLPVLFYATGYLSGFVFNPGWTNPFSYVGAVGSGWAAVIDAPTGGQAGITLCLPPGPFTDPTQPIGLWSWTLRYGPAAGQPMAPWISSNPPGVSPTKSADYSIELATTLGGPVVPELLVRTLETDYTQKFWTVTFGNDSRRWTWTELQPPTTPKRSDPVALSAGFRPVPDGENNARITNFLDVFMVADGTLSVVRQDGTGNTVTDAEQPKYYPPIPLEPGIALMVSQAGVSAGDELLLVGADGNLQTLLKDPSTGHWTGAPVQLPASELQQVSAYHTVLSVIDAWNRPVPGTVLTVAASTPVTALVDGQTVTLGQTPVNLTTDSQGQAIVATLADGLSHPTLTVTGAGLPTASINAAAGVNTYMQGKTPLNYQPPFTASTLSAATNADGTPLAPGAADPATAKAAVDNMSTAATWATSPSLTGARSASSLARREGQRTHPYPQPGQVTGAGSDINDWYHDALHAIKKAAVGVETVTYDAATKTFTLTGDFVQWTEAGLTVVIHGIEDAAHVLHAVFNKLEAAVDRAVKWLEAEVIGTFRDAIALAQQYEQWLSQSCTLAAGQIGSSLATVTTWLNTGEKWTTTQLTTLAGRFGHVSLADMGSSNGLSSPLNESGSSGSPHGDWLWRKIKNSFGNPTNLPPIADLDKLAAELLTAAEPVLIDVEDAFDGFKDFLVRLITDPSKVLELFLDLLVQELIDLTDAVFDLAKAIVSVAAKLLAAVFEAIPGIMSTPFLSTVPLIGALFRLAGIEGPSFGTILCALFAFPTVVAYKIAHGGHGRPFEPSTAAGHGSGLQAGDAASDLKLAAAEALTTWAFFDFISQAVTAGKGDPPAILGLVDIGAPIIVGFLTMPAKNGTPYLSPPVGSDPNLQNAFLAWLAGIVPAGFAATAAYLPEPPAGKTDPDADLRNLLLLSTWMAGMFSLTFGCAAVNPTANHSHWDYTGAVLNSMANIASPLLQKDLVDSSDGITAGVACAITLGCGIAGAIAVADGD